MARYNIRSLNYVKSSKKSIIFNIDYNEDTRNYDNNVVDKEKIENTVYQNKVYFGEVCDSDSLILDNFGSLYNITSAFVIHNLYSYDDSKIKTDIPIYYNSSETQDVYLPNIDIVDACQLGNEVFALTEKTSEDFCYNKANIDVNQYTHEYSYTLNISSDPIKTYLFSKDEKELIDIFDPNIAIENIKYNFIVDFPCNTSYHDYKQGFIYGNLLYGKNAYNSLYSMNISGESEVPMSAIECREYIGIGKINSDQIYLKYRDTADYLLTKKTDSIQKKLNNDNMSLYTAEEQPAKYTYQHIEGIESINKIDYVNNQHKSNMYSIEINDIGLNTTEWISDKVKDKLKQDIKNNIRSLVQVICPANTQLFEIYFTGN